ncbi:ABC transporter permease [Saccharothrix isguenensis]
MARGDVARLRVGVAQLGVLVERAVRAHVVNRRLLVFGLVQPAIMLVLFTQVFGNLIDADRLPSGVDYVGYVLPALLVTAGMGPAANSGGGLVREMGGGMLTRFRSLPVGLHWVLLARSLADLARVAGQLVVLLLFSVVAFGFRPPGGLRGAVLALLVALVVIWTLIWVFLALGAWLRDVEVMQSIAFVVVFPLMFASSAFAPVDALPGWLRVVAAVNPMTHAMQATRALLLDWDSPGTVAAALVASCVVLGVSGVLAVRGFRRPDVP